MTTDFQMEPTEELIQEFGEAYEKLMRRMKTPSNAGYYDNLRRAEVMVDLIKNPTEEKLKNIKETISYGMVELRTTPEFQRGEFELSEFQYKLLEISKDWRGIKTLINSLLNSTRARQ